MHVVVVVMVTLRKRGEDSQTSRKRAPAVGDVTGGGDRSVARQSIDELLRAVARRFVKVIVCL